MAISVLPRIVRLGCAALALLAVSPAPQDRLVRLPDGRRLNLSCAGTGAPTILLESGWSSDSRGWSRVFAPLAARHRVCAYDRAGSGRSDPGPLPRDAAAIARDLDEALRAARIGGPFVLVGHSSGGLYVRHFVQRRPRDVRGLVLVDPMVEDQATRHVAALGSLVPLIRRSERCLAAARAAPLPPADRCATSPPERAVDRWTARLSELQGLAGSARPSATLGDLPVVVIVADRTYAGAARQLWIDLHRDLARRSTRGEMRLAEGSGHAVMKDRPDMIVAAVEDVAGARRRP